MTKSIAIISGPSLNLLGEREPELYGRITLEEIEAMCANKAAEVGARILFFRQSNHEGVLIDWIQEARGKAGGLVINPAGLTFTSIAILDALKTFDGPIMEVHLTNIHKREQFRQTSYASLAATGVIAGLGPSGYTAAVQALAELLK